jgi:hypothetical protein
MEFLQEYLKTNQENNISFGEFISEYDIKHQTLFSLTLNYENAMCNILKKVIRDFLMQVNVSEINGTTKKVFGVLDLYFDYLENQNINIAVYRLLTFLRQNHRMKYAEYILDFSDKIWQYFDIYDEDQNFVTRRMKLWYIIHEMHVHKFSTK